MDERYYGLIDKYLRKEMSPDESLNFEQEAINNPELWKEIELTYLIKRSLADRQQKLRTTVHLRKKRKYRTVVLAVIPSFAAMLVLGLLIIRPMQENDFDDNIVATATIDTPEDLKENSEEAIASVNKSIPEGHHEVAIAEVSRLEELKVIHSLDDVSGEQFIMRHSLESKDADVFSQDAYELHWLKIKSLIEIGEKAEAFELLKSFVTVEGKYKVAADSLLSHWQ